MRRGARAAGLRAVRVVVRSCIEPLCGHAFRASQSYLRGVLCEIRLPPCVVRAISRGDETSALSHALQNGSNPIASGVRCRRPRIEQVASVKKLRRRRQRRGDAPGDAIVGRERQITTHCGCQCRGLSVAEPTSESDELDELIVDERPDFSTSRALKLMQVDGSRIAFFVKDSQRLACDLFDDDEIHRDRVGNFAPQARSLQVDHHAGVEKQRASHASLLCDPVGPSSIASEASVPASSSASRRAETRSRRTNRA